MISKNSLSLAELLKGVSLPEPTDLIQGLNNVSFDILPYTENYKEEVVEATAVEHTEVIELVSTKLADVIRQSLHEVKDYGLPVAYPLSSLLTDVLCHDGMSSGAESHIDNTFRIQMMNVDNLFFSSPLYPTEVANTLLNYDSVDLSVYNRLSFDTPTKEQVLSFINTNHPEIVNILEEYDGLINGDDYGYGLLNPLYLFISKETERSLSVNFSTVNTAIGLNIEALITNYVLVTKMKTSDDPVSWLRGGNLSDYREFVTLMWNGLTNYLISLKNYCDAYKARGFVIQGMENSSFNDNESIKGLKTVNANIKVYYTSEVLDKLLSNNYSLRELMIGKVWERLVNGGGYHKGSVVDEAQHLQEQYNSYVSYVSEKLGGYESTHFVGSGLRSITNSIQSTEVLKSVFDQIIEPQGVLLNTFVEREFGELLNRCYNQVRLMCVEGASELQTLQQHERSEVILGYLLSTEFVSTFLGTCGCKLSSSIIERTNIVVARNEDNISNKRCNVTIALVEEIVALCFKE